MCNFGSERYAAILRRKRDFYVKARSVESEPAKAGEAAWKMET